jgi:hypothetical protein
VASLIYHHPKLVEVHYRDTIGALSELEAMGGPQRGYSLRALTAQSRRGVNEDLERALLVNPTFSTLEVINTGTIKP